MNNIETLTQILRESKNVVFFGGAGADRLFPGAPSHSDKQNPCLSLK